MGRSEMAFEFLEKRTHIAPPRARMWMPSRGPRALRRRNARTRLSLGESSFQMKFASVKWLDRARSRRSLCRARCSRAPTAPIFPLDPRYRE